MIARLVGGAVAVAVVITAPSAQASEYDQSFHRSGADVFAALSASLPSLGFKVRSTNPSLKRVVFSAGMSAFSWGEDMSIVVVEKGPEDSVLVMDGELKMSSNILAQGRVMKHFNAIVTDIDRRLSQTQAATQTALPSAK